MVGFVSFIKIVYPRQSEKALRLLHRLQERPLAFETLSNEFFPTKDSKVKFSNFTKKLRELHLIKTEKGMVRLTLDGFGSEVDGLKRSAFETLR